ncbi:MAG: hypothetical protein H7A50_00550 [Akkermansiaceae bacterium]|nr:hypothetical protein [Akkermansiaceae bacterium]
MDLVDFRSPKRLLPGSRDWLQPRKGTHLRQRSQKQAFGVLRDYYEACREQQILTG